MKEPTRVLIVEDKSSDADLAKHAIQKVLEDCEFRVVETRCRLSGCIGNISA